MPNMTIQEAADYLGVSKEAIHNRVRRGSLGVSVVGGIKYVNIDGTVKNTSKSKPRRTGKTSSVSDDKYYKLLEDQNSKLQTKVEKLESETRTLRDQKELMLIEERKKIEQIYKEKDEQLKNVLNTLSSQFMLNAPLQIDEQEEHLDAEIELEETPKESELVPLKKYLKGLNISEKKQKKIQKKVKKIAKKDDRITTLGSKCYLDTIKHDYKDLF